MKITKRLLGKILKPKSKYVFLDSINKNCKLLDVGCGNNSPYNIKSLRPDIFYIGLDIEIYNQNTAYNEYANSMVLCTADEFADKIYVYENGLDAIISAHNLEHCNDYMAVTKAMINALRKGGKLFLAFPCEASINFPKRDGTLNFNDDDTHRNLIPYKNFIEILEQNGMKINFSTPRYRPFVLFLLGLIYEPISFITKKNGPEGITWALYGFETIIIAEKM